MYFSLYVYRTSLQLIMLATFLKRCWKIDNRNDTVNFHHIFFCTVGISCSLRFYQRSVAPRALLCPMELEEGVGKSSQEPTMEGTGRVRAKKKGGGREIFKNGA